MLQGEVFNELLHFAIHGISAQGFGFGIRGVGFRFCIQLDFRQDGIIKICRADSLLKRFGVMLFLYDRSHIKTSGRVWR